MFKKKKKNISKTNFEEEIDVTTAKEDKIRELEDEIVVVTSKEEPDDEFVMEFEEEPEEIMEINIIDDEFVMEVEETEELKDGDFIFFDNDPTTECAVDEVDDDLIEEIYEEPIEEQIMEEKIIEEPIAKEEVNENKKDIGRFFEKSKKNNKKLKVKPTKKKKLSKKEQIKAKEFTNLKNQRVFVFRKKKYTKVEDFIKYLNNNYLDIDKIAQEVLDNKNFYGWISKKSGVFEDSIIEFKQIKEKIEKK